MEYRAGEAVKDDSYPYCLFFVIYEWRNFAADFETRKELKEKDRDNRERY